MRYESVGDTLTLVPETSAVIQNMDKTVAVSAQMTTSGKTTTVLLYPGQKISYQNSIVYLKSVKAGSTIRVRIDPLSYDPVTDEPTDTDTQVTPTTPKTDFTGDVDISGDLTIGGKTLEELVEAAVRKYSADLTLNSDEVLNALRQALENLSGGSSDVSIHKCVYATDEEIEKIADDYLSEESISEYLEQTGEDPKSIQGIVNSVLMSRGV